jgi:hypothetical protein
VVVLALLSAAVLGCGSASAGPTGAGRSRAGAVCMLEAYQDHCRDAVYTLSVLGIDTVRRRAFTISGCRVAVTETFRVVPQPPHATGTASCTAIRRAGDDIVATGCAGTLGRTISLTH